MAVVQGDLVGYWGKRDLLAFAAVNKPVVEIAKGVAAIGETSGPASAVTKPGLREQSGGRSGRAVG